MTEHPAAAFVCARCRREVWIEDAEYVNAEVIDGEHVCGSCVTRGEEQEIFDDYAEDMFDDEGGAR